MSENKVDQRVMQMVFDNVKFERGIRQSMESIDAFKKKMDMTSVNKNLSKVTGSIDLSHLATAVDKINSRFSTMGMVATGALQSIGQQAYFVGQKIFDALYTNPRKLGLSEYETKMGAIQTILTNTKSKGTTLDHVVKSLDDLNVYADKTIYNFAEMTRNIGTFTAAGVGLEDATEAIKGIANLGAGSGSNPQQVATAMYQMSQAMNQPYLMLMDYNSLVNAGMGGELFKKEALKVARALGTIPKELGNDMDILANWREDLNEGWLTNDVLKQVFQNFANNEDLTKAATEVKTFTALMGTLAESMQSQWAQSWEYIIGDFDQAKKLFTTLSSVIGDFINSGNINRNKALEEWSKGGGRTVMLVSLTKLFQELGKVIEVFSDSWAKVFPPITGKTLLDLTQKFGIFASNFSISEKTITNIRRVLDGLFSTLKMGAQIVKLAALAIFDIVKLPPGTGGGMLEFLAGIGDAMTEMYKSGTLVSNVKYYMDKLVETVGNLKQRFSELFDIDIAGALDDIKNRAKSVGDVLNEALTNIFSKESLDTALGVGAFSGIVYGIIKFVEMFQRMTFAEILGSANDVLEGFTNTLNAMTSSIKSQSIMNIATSVALLAGAIFVLSIIDPERVSNSLMTILTTMGALIFGMNMLVKYTDPASVSKVIALGVALVGVSIGVAILAAAVTALSFVPFSTVLSGMLNVMTMLIGVAIFANLVRKSANSLLSAGVALVPIAIGLLILSGALWAIGSLDPAKIQLAMNVMIAFFVSVAALAGVAYFAGPMILALSVAMIGMAIAFNLLLIPLLAFAHLSMDQIAASLTMFGGVVGIAVLGLGALAAVMYAMSFAIVGAAALLIVSGAMVIFSYGALIFATAVAVAVGAIAALTMIDTSNLSEIGINLSKFLMLLSPGLYALAGALLFLAPGLLLTATAFVIFGLAITTIGYGLTTASVALGLFVVAMGGLLALGAGFSEFGEAFKAGILVIFDTIIAATPKIFEFAVVLIIALCDGLVAAIPYIVTATYTLLMALVEALDAFIPSIVVAAGRLIMALIEGIVLLVPLLVEETIKIGIAFMDALIIGINNNMPTFIKKLKELCDVIVDNFLYFLGVGPEPEFREMGRDVGKAYADGVASGIKDGTPDVSIAGKGLMGAVTPWQSSFGLSSGGIPTMARKSEEYVNMGHYMPTALQQEFKSIDERITENSTRTKGLDKKVQKISSEKKQKVEHTFKDPIRIKGYNDKNEFLGSVDFVVEDFITAEMRRQIRRG